jgi:hypothetical protein
VFVGLLHLAEGWGVEDLLEADHPGSLLGGRAHVLSCLSTMEAALPVHLA